jgi:hypothetical protein
MTTEHYFRTVSLASADALAADLQARGHLIDRVESDVVISASGHDEVARSAELGALATRHGADYDGNGTFTASDG